MTYTTKLLALALEINPNVVWAIEDETVFDLYGGEEFDPANNSDQAIEVWCWLIAQLGTTDAGGVIEVRFNSRPQVYGYTYETPAQWRAAVLKAALRVISASARSPQ